MVKTNRKTLFLHFIEDREKLKSKLSSKRFPADDKYRGIRHYHKVSAKVDNFFIRFNRSAVTIKLCRGTHKDLGRYFGRVESSGNSILKKKF